MILKKKGSQIIRDAEIQGENIKKEKIFQAKEKFLQLKSEHEQQINEKKLPSMFFCAFSIPRESILDCKGVSSSILKSW